MFPARNARVLLLSLFLSAILGADSGWARTIWVDCVLGDDLTGDGTELLPYRRVETADDFAVPGDTIRVKPGLCDASNQRFPITLNPGVSVVGSGPWQTYFVANSTITAFQFADEGMSFPRSQLLADMNIRAVNDAIQLWNGSPTIRNNVIHDSNRGIAITSMWSDYLQPNNEANPLIEDNYFYDNIRSVVTNSVAAAVGPVIRRNRFNGDSSSDAAIYGYELGDTVAPVIENNFIEDVNFGIIYYAARPTIVNNTITQSGTAIRLDTFGSDETKATRINNNILAYNEYGIVARDDSFTYELFNNDFFDNDQVDYLDSVLGPIEDFDFLPEAAGNLRVPAFLVDRGDEYNLTRISPMIDAGAPGAPSTDLELQVRIPPADIGCDEFYGEGAPVLRLQVVDLTDDRCPGQMPPGGDADVDPGETLEIFVELLNFSQIDATGVEVSLRSPDGDFTVAAPNRVVVPDVGPYTLERAVAPFVIQYEPPLLMCQPELRLEALIRTTQLGIQGAQTHTLLVGQGGCDPCNGPSRADLVFDGWDIADTCPVGAPPGGNGSADPGERIRLTPRVRNQDLVAGASGVVATIRTVAPGVTVTAAQVVLGPVAPGATATAADAFELIVAGSVACGTSLPIEVDLQWLERGGGPPVTVPTTLDVPALCTLCVAPAPSFDLAMAPTVDDVCTSGGPGANSQIEPGETILLSVPVRNLSTTMGATEVSGIVHAVSTTVLTPVQRATVIGDVGPGASSLSTAVPFTVAASAMCGEQLDFEIELTSLQTGPIPTRLPFSLFVAGPGCATCTDVPPTLGVAAPALTDLCVEGGLSSGNDEIDPGEIGEFTFSVFNSSPTNGATNVIALVELDRPWFDPIRQEVALGDIAPLAIASAPGLRFQTSANSFIVGRSFRINVAVSSAESGPVPPAEFRYSIGSGVCAIAEPVLSVVAHRTPDLCLNANPPTTDGGIDPGEIVYLEVDVFNDSAVTATTLAVRFEGGGPIVPRDGIVLGPDVPPGATVTMPPFGFQVAVDTPCLTPIPMNVRLFSRETGYLSSLDLTDVFVQEFCGTTCTPGWRLLRTSVTDLVPGWRTAIPLPQTSTSTLDPGYPHYVTVPGAELDTTTTLGSPKLLLYRVLDSVDGPQGNLLRLAKVGSSVQILF